MEILLLLNCSKHVDFEYAALQQTSTIIFLEALLCFWNLFFQVVVKLCRFTA